MKNAIIKSKPILLILSYIFAFCELLFAFLVHLGKKSLFKYFAFFSVLFAALFAFVYFCDSIEYGLIQSGLIFTLIADVFLVLLTEGNKLLAMLFFSAVQILYFLLLYKRDEKWRKLHLSLRASVILLALILTAVVLKKSADALSLISVFYFTNLLLNLAWAFVEFKISRFIAIGLLFFIMCDICVGLTVISNSYFPLPESGLLNFLAHPPINLVWLFYIPSQTFITLSLAELRLKNADKSKI